MCGGQIAMRDRFPLGYDTRLLGGCLYCGGPTTTSEHIPPKAFLDEPYPANLHTMKSCETCNNGYSVDEEYVSCLIDVAICGSTVSSAQLRPKVVQTFERKPHLARQIESQRFLEKNDVVWIPDHCRVSRIIEKVARGHASYDLGLRDLAPQNGRTAYVECAPLSLFSDAQREAFERPNDLCGWPELGSRAFYRVIADFRNAMTDWTMVQEGRYRYMALPDGPMVKIVLSEYLACQVSWD